MAPMSLQRSVLVLFSGFRPTFNGLNLIQRLRNSH
jgi:hypothetical protein